MTFVADLEITQISFNKKFNYVLPCTMEHYGAKKLWWRRMNFDMGKGQGGLQNSMCKKTTIFVFLSLYAHKKSESTCS